MKQLFLVFLILCGCSKNSALKNQNNDVIQICPFNIPTWTMKGEMFPYFSGNTANYHSAKIDFDFKKLTYTVNLFKRLNSDENASALFCTFKGALSDEEFSKFDSFFFALKVCENSVPNEKNCSIAQKSSDFTLLNSSGLELHLESTESAGCSKQRFSCDSKSTYQLNQMLVAFVERHMNECP